MKKPLGFTLLELMTFLAIFTLIITIALAAFQNYSIRAEFSELVLAAIPHKEAVERAIQIRNPSALTDLDGGSLGIPANITVGKAVHGVMIADGVITMTWQSDSTILDGMTYTLTLDDVKPPIQWSRGGSCVGKRLC